MYKQAENKIGIITKTIETEVIVCGGGTAGIITALTAAENGAKVILLEKGNNCYPPRTFIGAIGSKVQKEHGVEIDRNEIVNELCRHACYRVDQRLINLWADESGEMIDWLGSIMIDNGMKVTLETDINKNMDIKEWSTCHCFYNDNTKNKKRPVKILEERMKAHGVDIRTRTPMIQLIRDDDKVVGVIAKNSDGEYIQINASKGVVLATGGYSNNMEMLKELNPIAAFNISSLPLTPGVTGDGIKAAKKIGAEMDLISTAMIFDRGAVKPGKVAGEPFEDKLFWLGSQPFLKVNKLGERYTNESVPYDFCIHAASMQPGKVWCSIFDSNWMEDVLKFHTIGCSRVVLPEDIEKYPCNFNVKIVEGMNEQLLKAGYMQQANTIEELAEKLMLPPKTLEANIYHYNELCEKGEDEDFGKTSFRMRPIIKAPFYGITVGGNLLCTLDGLRINTDMQVLDTNMEPIKGLFAVGNDSGGFFAYSYPELTPGVAAGRSMTFGRHVGKYIADL
ncbi:FAD-dependent oxidoreductase [Clostridium estertheticum]|uniref:FAD-dependent oxidoreductase n=1 Tax=Clostridium estertheticum TaxID=238834 RepID=UPI001C0E1372|nr:FAD-dependent oxidoreductase [Clostridium estertheticum]MBU3071819.1 FAD-dependent oxidoreductase [Clostridium estertheticum]MBU3161911.1 FAD-dependent oxidoreductase [Clostridium estertheticum]